MSKQEYMRKLREAVLKFTDTAMELDEDGEEDIQQWNDEFMLELYEQTGDERRA